MAFEDITKGAGTGASIGGAIGSAFVPGIGTAIGAGLGGLAGGAAGGLFGRRKNEETDTQRKQRELVDQLLSSLNGQGPYSDLFNANEQDFEKYFAEPARNRFRSQTAPQIQQQYIASGQQRGTGFEDTLTRAGVNMDDLLNQSYMDYVQNAQNRKANAVSGILGLGAGPQREQGYGEAALQGVGGYLSGDAFPKDLEGIIEAFQKRGNKSQEDEFPQQRKGFENDNTYYDPYAGVQP